MRQSRSTSSPTTLPAWLISGAISAVLSASIAACGGGDASSSFDKPTAGDDAGAWIDGGSGGNPPPLGTPDPTGSGGDGGVIEQPRSCAEAASAKSYVGCDFWPTVVFNPVYAIFDFAAVVANASDSPADIQVTRDGKSVTTTTIAPGAVSAVYLPWVPELKGKDFDGCTNGGRPTASIRVNGGAYHLTSSMPVTVWQFNPLEYKSGAGGPPGKDWTCPYAPALCNGNGVDCLSVSNDASLLLPATAMTGNYRLFGKTGTTYGSAYPPETDQDSPGAFAITATQDATNLVVHLASGADVAPGAGVSAAKGGTSMTFTLAAGDVVQLLGARGTTYNALDAELSGSVVTADKPVQVIAVNAITDMPSPIAAGNGWADHLEEAVLPAEALGSHYIVAPPTAPAGNTVGHFVRFYGNRDGTVLTYSGAAPSGAPTKLEAGDIVDIASSVNEPFEVQGSHEFAVASIMMGSQIQDPSADPRGDPSMTFAVSVEQFRHRYVFLAPTDYEVSFADVVVPTGAKVTLDGAPLSGTSVPIGAGWSVVHAPLSAAKGGAHDLQSDQEVGLTIMGFGHATSYYAPGGLNLKLIAPPPPPPK